MNSRSDRAFLYRSLTAGDRHCRPAVTFRLTDIVGLDTAVMVIRDSKTVRDKTQQQLKLPDVLTFFENKWFGDKSGKGFYEKTNRR
ncbi:MAG: 3-hydroxyacyl-CoA dehydrogenase family protein [Saprospiraceae bacterium]